MLPKSIKDFNKLIDSKYGFISYFDPNSGFYIRTEDPFMASFPQLLDIGIMGHCNLGLTGRCLEIGIQCYQSGPIINEPNMQFEDFKHIIDKSAGRVFQIALGGRGDPELHKDFEEILAYSREKSIVPNLTTSGFMLTKEEASIMKKYCGAVAVSWYKKDYTEKAIDILINAGVKTNIHFVLSRSSIDEAIEIIEERNIPSGINRIIFLLFKPVGLGREENVLSISDKRVKYFFELFNTEEVCNMAGFDSCCTPALLNYSLKVDPNCYDTCEGGRFSAYITPDMKMLPCSFDQSMQWMVNLREKTIEEAWFSSTFDDFRNKLKTACNDCSKRISCMGGCPIRPQITLCENKKFN